VKVKLREDRLSKVRLREVRLSKVRLIEVRLYNRHGQSAARGPHAALQTFFVALESSS
jgi:hypothetical protein